MKEILRKNVVVIFENKNIYTITKIFGEKADFMPVLNDEKNK